MRKLCCTVIVICLWAVLSGFAQAPTLAMENAPEDIAIWFMETLQEGSWQYAANLCTDPDEFHKWTPPFVTKYLVFPSVDEIAVKQAKVSGDTAEVILSLSAADFGFIDEVGFTLADSFLWELCLSDDYAAEDCIVDENWVWLINGSSDLMTQVRKHRKQYEIPFSLKNVQGKWLIDLMATKKLRQVDSLELAPLSYGRLSYDYAQKRYYIKHARYNDALWVPADMEWGKWLQSVTADEVFDALGQPKWNVWLRLKTQGDAHGLYGFSVSDSKSQCESQLVEYADFGFTVQKRYWATIGGQTRAVLEMYIPEADGKPLGNIPIQCRRRMNTWTPLYFEDELSISLEGVPHDSGLSEGGISFTADHFMRVKEASRMKYGIRTAGDTLGKLMVDEFDSDNPDDSVFLNVPAGISDLPVLNSEYALYRLEGTMKKEQGDFGVYDVTFDLATPVEGVWVEAYEQCSSECDEIDRFDLMGAESTMREMLQSSFDVQVLVRIDGRSEQELNTLLRSLKIAASFSCEEWDFSYEQHGTTTRIGPRSALAIDLSQMELWPGTVMEIPRAETIYADSRQ